MKRYYSKMDEYNRWHFIEYSYHRQKIPRREQHKILVWYEKTKKRDKRYFQTCRDTNVLPF